MKFKYWKPIVLVISSVLLFIEVVIVIYDINDGKIEWGNVSDWLSSLSTFGTLLIAYAAYVKAPDWIKQRKDEDAFSIASDLINEKLPHIVGLVHRISNDSFHLRDALGFVEDRHLKLYEVSDLRTCEGNLKIWEEHDIFLTQAFKDVSKLNRLGWQIKTEMLESMNKMRHELSIIYRYHTNAWIRVKDAIVNNSAPLNNESLIKNLARLHLAEENFKDAYSIFEKSFIDIEEYFNIKNR